MQIGVWIPNCRHLATPENIRSSSPPIRELDEQMTAFAERVRPRLG